MKFNRILPILLAALLTVALFAGCAKTETADTTQSRAAGAPPTQAAGEPQASQSDDHFWFTHNGVEIHMGVPFAELAEKLGSESKPSETIESCDPGSDWVQIQHYYPGITVHEDKDGNVFGVEMSEWNVPSAGDLTMNGVLKLHESTRDDVVAALGEPEPNEYGIFYDFDGYTLCINLDESTGLLDSVMVTQN